jgi:hypothetical protein
MKILPLIILLSINLHFINAQHILTVEDVNFDTSTGTIKDYFGTYTDIVIPQYFEIEGNVIYVTKIESTAFYKNNLTGVYISEGIQSIGRMAFGLNNITKINIPASINFIGPGAFNNNQISTVNEKLSNGIFYSYSNGSIDSTKTISYGGASKKVDFIPVNVKTIGDGSFQNCAIDEVTLPPKLETIEVVAFWENNLTNVVIPNSVYFIDKSAFYFYNLNSAIVLPSPVVKGTAKFINWKDNEGLVVTNIYDPEKGYSAQFFKNEPEYPDVNMISSISSYVVPGSVYISGTSCYSDNRLDVTISLSNYPVTLDYLDVNFRSINEPHNIVSSKRVFFKNRDGVLFSYVDGREIRIKRGILSLSFDLEEFTENQLCLETMLYSNGQLKGYFTDNILGLNLYPYIWENPSTSPIQEGEPLQNSILTGGIASVCGQFKFKSPELIPPSGSYEAVIQFIPTRSDIYGTVETSVIVDVAISTGLKKNDVGKFVINHESYTNMVHIDSGQERILEISIIGPSGALLACYKGNGSPVQALNLDNYKSGIYIIMISTFSNVITKKIIIP